MDEDDCPHVFTDFLDVVFCEEYQYEQRYKCRNCGALVLVQIGAFGAHTNMRVVQ